MGCSCNLLRYVSIVRDQKKKGKKSRRFSGRITGFNFTLSKLVFPGYADLILFGLFIRIGRLSKDWISSCGQVHFKGSGKMALDLDGFSGCSSKDRIVMVL